MNKLYPRFITALIILTSVFSSAMAQSKGFDISRMDTSVDACNDFYEYANGSWLKRTELPPAFSRWNGFFILNDSNQAILKDILEDAAKSKSPAGSPRQMIGDYYASCMDEAAIEKAGGSVLGDYFKQIDRIKDAKQLQHQIALFHNDGENVLFNFFVSPDAKNSRIYIASARQSGLSLPARDYYTKTDDKSVEVRAKLVEHLTNMFKLAGDPAQTAAANAATIMKIETRLAGASKTPAEIRDSEANYHKKNLAELAALTPNFSWPDYMRARNLPSSAQAINIGQPEFFAEVDKMLVDTPLADWKIYLRWRILNAEAQNLSKNFADESFNFFGKYLSGVKEQQPRWKRCTGNVDNSLGEALGQEYVKKAFSPAAKQKLNEMIDNLMAAYRVRISQLDWMSDETKRKALEKLAAFRRKIAYPDTLRGYQGLTVDNKSYFVNSRRSSAFLVARNLRDFDQKVDPLRWGMTPPTVNASYNSPSNSITFPAGILRPPFFNPDADDAINYGAIGGVIGHEITHGFDNDGSKFDGDGNLKMWWTPEDRAKFEERTSCVVKQFDGFEVLPGVHINGKLTLGENIADLGGLTISYLAYQKSLEGKPRPANIDGLTPEQRFFLGWAQAWATKATPEFQRRQVLSDEHANERYRVNGPLSNMPQFAAAFGCKDSSPMVRRDFCRIW